MGGVLLSALNRHVSDGRTELAVSAANTKTVNTPTPSKDRLSNDGSRLGPGWVQISGFSATAGPLLLLRTRTPLVPYDLAVYLGADGSSLFSPLFGGVIFRLAVRASTL